MKKLLVIWLCGAFLLWGYSMGLDTGCKRETSVENPVLYLAWPAAMIAIASGWKSDKKDVCE